MPYLKAKHLSARLKRLNEKLDTANRKLVYVGREIRFQSEKDLEDYIEAYFNIIFTDLVLVKRQHNIKMQRCDLLCCTKTVKQPVVIELKNEEDRGIVSQLTRYRKAILIDKPFAEQIDYSFPVMLVAIAPTFHEDNYTDKESSKFQDDFCFWEFSVENYNNSGKFKLCGQTYDIPYPIFGLPEIPPNSELYNSGLPVFTSNFIGSLSPEYHNDFMALRSLLVSQPKVKEMVSPTYRKILYGTGEGENHKKLAEITNTGKGLCLFLWLPSRNSDYPQAKAIARFGFVMKPKYNPLSRQGIVEYIVFCRSGAINMKDKPTSENSLSDFKFSRGGMLKWCKPNEYLYQASGLYSRRIFKDLFWSPSLGDYDDWWKSFEKQSHVDLGWYIDLAIKTWNYRVK